MNCCTFTFYGVESVRHVHVGDVVECVGYGNSSRAFKLRDGYLVLSEEKMLAATILAFDSNTLNSVVDHDTVVFWCYQQKSFPVAKGYNSS